MNKNSDFKIICGCGAVLNLIDDPDEAPTYTEGVGYYKVRGDRDIEIYSGYDTVFFKCGKCGAEIWIFE